MKHVDELAGGRKRFRRRWPKDVGEALGEKFMQRPIQAREGAALVPERRANSAGRVRGHRGGAQALSGGTCKAVAKGALARGAR